MSKRSEFSQPRRKIIKGAAASAAVIASPWVINSKVLASSGELNVMMWSDYLSAGFFKAFEEKSGIKINFTGIGSNEEIINKMKASKGRGIDICSPTNMRSPQWSELGLLQAFDYGRIATIGNVNPAMLKVGAEEWDFGGKGSHWLPLIWGTEGVAWRTDQWTPPRDGEIPSYGDIWQEDVKGKTMMRAHSGMLGAGLYLETTGQLDPGAMKGAYNDEAIMRKVWAVVTDFCIANKAQIKLFWNDADSQKNGLLNDGVVVGQTWDGPILTMKKEGKPVTYMAPKEGAMTWVDSMSIVKNAENLEQAYAFINWAYTAEAGAIMAKSTGYNSVVKGVDALLDAKTKQGFNEAYPGNALENLWWYPNEQPWFVPARTEYRDKFQAA